MAKRLHVTAHAIKRCVERVAHIANDEAALTFLSREVVKAAANFGDCDVRLPTGQRIVIRHHSVITVTPKPLRRKCQRGKS